MESETKQNKTKKKTTKLIDTENRLVVTRGGGWGWEVGKMFHF